MTAARVCSECGASLEGKSAAAKTCSTRCRQIRARRRKHLPDEAMAAEQGVREVIRRESEGAIERIMHQELQPVVREAIDENVLKAVRDLLALTPAAVHALEDDLHSSDAVLRQRAATTVVRYTVGHPALVKPKDEEHAPLEIHFNLPRPVEGSSDASGAVSAGTPAGAGIVDTTPEEDKVCDLCGSVKPLTEFVSGSDRCRTCFEQWKADVLRSLE